MANLQIEFMSYSLTLHLLSSEQAFKLGYKAPIDSGPKTSTNLLAASIPLPITNKITLSWPLVGHLSWDPWSVVGYSGRVGLSRGSWSCFLSRGSSLHVRCSGSLYPGRLLVGPGGLVFRGTRFPRRYSMILRLRFWRPLLGLSINAHKFGSNWHQQPLCQNSSQFR